MKIMKRARKHEKWKKIGAMVVFAITILLMNDRTMAASDSDLITKRV